MIAVVTRAEDTHVSSAVEWLDTDHVAPVNDTVGGIRSCWSSKSESKTTALSLVEDEPKRSSGKRRRKWLVLGELRQVKGHLGRRLRAVE